MENTKLSQTDNRFLLSLTSLEAAEFLELLSHFDLSPTVAGSLHDKALADELELEFMTGQLLLEDLGLLGYQPKNTRLDQKKTETGFFIWISSCCFFGMNGLGVGGPLGAFPCF